MHICSFTIPFKKIYACSMVFVECIICFVELKEASSYSYSSSSSHLVLLSHEASHNTTKLKCGTNFIA